MLASAAEQCNNKIRSSEFTRSQY